MPLFKYKAATADGKISEVLIEGDSPPDSLARLRNRGLVPLKCYGEVNEYGNAPGVGALFRKKFDIYDFTNSLVPLLQAHIQLERALGIIIEGMEDKRSRNIVTEIRRGLHEGKKFSALIRNQGKLFPRIYANLIEAGEETGSVTEVMCELQRFLNERREMRDFMVTSSIYPSIVLTVTFGVIILLFTVFVPRFSRIFTDMGKPLPLPTQILLNISQALTAFWWLWLVLIAAIAFFVSRVKKGGRYKEWWDGIVLRIPVFGKIAEAAEISRFIRTLAVLIKNHVHLLKTVSIASRIIGNETILNSFSDISYELRSGSKLSEALVKSPFMPKTAVQMLRIGEESGQMGEMLDNIAERYENELKIKIKRLLALFEPAVILFLAFVVLAVVISIFLAILEMNQI